MGERRDQAPSGTTHRVAHDYTQMLATGHAAWIVALLVIATFGGALWSTPMHPDLRSTGVDPIESDRRAATGLDLHDVTLEWHDTVEHRQTSERLAGLDETLGAGLCAFDANGDGYVDLFVVGGSGHTRHYGRESWWASASGSRLLLNAGGDHFTDATKDFALTHRMAGMGCATADFDGDGDVDLLLTGRHALRLYENVENIRFSDATAAAGFDSGTWTTGAAVADYDRDGLVDVYVSGYLRFRRNARTFERATGFHDQVAAAFDPTLYDPAPGRLYRNLGGLRFQDVAVDVGVDDARGRGLGARWIDANADGLLDLYLLNDAGSPSQLFLGRPDGGFARTSGALREVEIEGARDVAVLHLDSLPAFVVTRGRGEASVILRSTRAGSRPLDIAWRSGLSSPTTLALDAWGIARGDLDNDGDDDLVLAHGSALPDLDSAFVPQGQPNLVAENLGGGRFAPSLEALGDSAPRSSRAVLATDLDNDGRLEVVISNNNDPIQILHADHAVGNWIAFDFSGIPERFDAAGGQIILVTSDGRRVTRALGSKGSFLSQGDRREHFGLGAEAAVATGEIAWADGTTWRFGRLDGNRYWRLDADGGIEPLEAPPRRLRPDARRIAALEPARAVSLARLAAAGTADRFDVRAYLDVWSRATPDQRHALLSDAAVRHAAAAVAILRHALSDPSGRVRAEAVRRLVPLELEASAEWLTPMLADADPGVACAAAEAFRVFFVEEEALVHRKRLAVTPLVRMLEEKEAERVLCAARALAEAESQRSVRPLEAVLSTSSDERQRVEALRALGRTRDRSAISTVRGELASTRATPEAVAAAVRALALLGSEEGAAHLAAWASEPTNGAVSDAERVFRLEVLAEITRNGDAPSGVARAARDALDRLTSDMLGSPGRDDRAFLAAVRALANARQTIPNEFVSRVLRAGSRETRIAGLVALAEQRSPRWDPVLTASIFDASSALSNEVLARLAQRGTRIPREAAEQWVRTGRTNDLIQSHLAGLPRAAATALATELLLADDLPLGAVSALLSSCVDDRLGGWPAAAKYLSGDSMLLRAGAADCLLGPSDEIRVLDGRPLPLATRDALLRAIDDPALDACDREDLLVRAAARDDVIARTRLVAAVRTLSPGVQPRAIFVLRERGHEEQVRPWLEGLLRGTSTSDAARIEAGLSLLAMGHEEARQRVLEEFSVR